MYRLPSRPCGGDEIQIDISTFQNIIRNKLMDWIGYSLGISTGKKILKKLI